MLRFVFWTAFFVVLGGSILTFGVYVPFVSNYLGQLPGDFILVRNDTDIYFPLTSAAILSIFFTIILSFFSSKK